MNNKLVNFQQYKRNKKVSNQEIDRTDQLQRLVSNFKQFDLQASAELTTLKYREAKFLRKTRMPGLGNIENAIDILWNGTNWAYEQEYRFTESMPEIQRITSTIYHNRDRVIRNVETLKLEYEEYVNKWQVLIGDKLILTSVDKAKAQLENIDTTLEEILRIIDFVEDK